MGSGASPPALDRAYDPANRPGDASGGSAGVCSACARWQADPALPRTPRSYAALKRTLDILFATLLLVCLSPLLVLIALAIWLDSPGSVLFHQQRVGRHCSIFNMVKFRTMIADRRCAASIPPQGVERRRVHKSEGDPRVTRVGRFLRRACLDELPQLWNVLNGDMSLVGPRPELPDIVERYDGWQHARHAVVPGITGWWQINRDKRRLMHEATELDLYYVWHRSLRLDLYILVRTALVVVRGVGAF